MLGFMGRSFEYVGFFSSMSFTAFINSWAWAQLVSGDGRVCTGSEVGPEGAWLIEAVVEPVRFDRFEAAKVAVLKAA